MEALGTASALLSIADVVFKAIRGVRKMLKRLKSAGEDMVEFIKSITMYASILHTTSNTVEQMQRLQLRALREPDVVTLTEQIINASNEHQKSILEATKRVKYIILQCSSASPINRYCKGKWSWLRYEHTVIKKLIAKIQPAQGCISLFHLVLCLRLELEKLERMRESNMSFPWHLIEKIQNLQRRVRLAKKEMREAQEKCEHLESKVARTDASLNRSPEDIYQAVKKVLSNTNQLRSDLGIRKSRSEDDSVREGLSSTGRVTSTRSHDNAQLCSSSRSLSSSSQTPPSLTPVAESSQSSIDAIVTHDDSGLGTSPEPGTESDGSWPCSLHSGSMIVFTEKGQVDRRGRRRRSPTSRLEPGVQSLPDSCQASEVGPVSRIAVQKEKLRRSGGIEILPDPGSDRFR